MHIFHPKSGAVAGAAFSVSNCYRRPPSRKTAPPFLRRLDTDFTIACYAGNEVIDMIWFALACCICLVISLSHLLGGRLFLLPSTVQRVRTGDLPVYQRLVGLAYLLLALCFLLLCLGSPALRRPCLAACLLAPCLLLYANKRYAGQWVA